MSDQAVAATQHDDEPHGDNHVSRLNWLRAGVLGANDGIVSTAGLVIGVAAATTNERSILIAGVAGLAAGALSMAAGEYVSVSTQRDTERALLAKEKHELRTMPEEELLELTGMLRDKGLSEGLAAQVADELTAHDALAAHAEIELGIDPDNLVNPWHAAWASMLAFTLGALLPLLTIVLAPAELRTYITFAAVAVALGLAGWISARLGQAPVMPAVLRNMGGGMLAMVITHVIGLLVGVGVA